MGKRLLIIDDETNILEVLSIVFENEGYIVITSNSAVATADLVTIKPDLILSDIRILGSSKTGLEICSEIKASRHYSHLPVILLSGESNIGVLARECGADAFIRKPFEIDELVNCIKNFAKNNHYGTRNNNIT